MRYLGWHLEGVNDLLLNLVLRKDRKEVQRMKNCCNLFVDEEEEVGHSDLDRLDKVGKVDHNLTFSVAYSRV